MEYSDKLLAEAIKHCVTSKAKVVEIIDSLRELV
jgi:hypothetical protein